MEILEEKMLFRNFLELSFKYFVEISFKYFVISFLHFNHCKNIIGTDNSFKRKSLALMGFKLVSKLQTS